MDQNGFRDIKPLMNEGAGACPGTHQGTSWPVLLNASYHMKHECIV